MFARSARSPLLVIAALCASVLTAPSGFATQDYQTFESAASSAGFLADEVQAIEDQGLTEDVPVSYDDGDTDAMMATGEETVVNYPSGLHAIGLDPITNTPSTSVWAKSTTCRTYTGTETARNYLGAALLSFTVSVNACVTKWSSVPGPIYSWHYKLSSAWSPQTTDAHINHVTYSLASVLGWSYEGLDSSGNWGPTITANPNGLSAQRRGHWHYHIGWGPFSLSHNFYPYVRFELNSQGQGTIYWGGHS